MGFLGLEGVAEFLFLLCGLFFKLCKAFFNAVLGEDKLRRGVNADGGELFDGALGEGVKASDGIHLIAPKLDAVRVFLGQVKNVDDAAANGKLAGGLHLVGALIAHVYKGCGEMLFVEGGAGADAKDIALRHEHGLGRHECGIGGDNGGGLVFKEPAERFHALAHQLVAVNVRLEEDQILGGVKSDVLVVEFIFFKEFFGV